MLLQSIINGILFGAVYATIGIGFSLVWGVMNIINVAHGSFIMIGAYLSYTFYTAFGLDPFLSIPLNMAILFAMGYLIQKFVLNRVVRGSVFITLTFTFGLLFAYPYSSGHQSFSNHIAYAAGPTFRYDTPPSV